MLARWRAEFIYARGLVRAVKGSRSVVATPSKTAGDYLEQWAREFGDRPALADNKEAFTYRQFDKRANQYARWAKSIGLVKGDAVALMMPNRPEYMAIWFGFARAGLATALINTNLTGAALAHSFAVVNAKVAVIETSLMPAFASAAPLLPAPINVFSHGASATGEPRVDIAVSALSGEPLSAEERPDITIGDPALFVYTSGTTGLPKAARITHSRLLRGMMGFSGAVGARASDRIYVCLPMYHANGGFIGPGVVFRAGGSVFIREKFSASAFWGEIRRERCTMFAYIGELCRYLLNAPPGPDDRSHGLRMCLGNGLRPDIFAAFQKRFALPSVLEFYASTEGNAVMMNLDSRPGAVGRIPAWVKSRFPMKIVAYDIDANLHRRDAQGHCVEAAPDEVGELLAEIRDDPKMPAARFDGYVDPAATKAKILRDVFTTGDSWFRSGDLLRRDKLGYFYFVDRIGDTFRWKGENVSTTEVAETICLFPGVREATVYGVAIARHDGRAGMAALVVDSIADFDLTGLYAHLSRSLASYARPMFLRFKSDLDVTGTFKQKKTELIAEGFDPRAISEPLYRDDRAANAYLPVRAEFVDGIESGKILL